MQKISATMALTLAEMAERGGELVRWQGGFWTYPGCAAKTDRRERVPEWHVATGTISALLRRGEIVTVEKGRWGESVRVRLSEANADALVDGKTE